MIIDKEKYNTRNGFEPMILYCFNNNLKEKLCNYYKTKPGCRNLTIEEQRKYFEEHQEEFKERIRRYNSGQIDVGDFIQRKGVTIMVKCNSPYAYCEKCIIDMDGMDSQGGIICCDTAEDLDFDRKEILNQCEYAEEI